MSRSEYFRQHYLNHKDEIRARKAAYYEADPQRRIKHRQWNADWRKRNAHEVRLMRSYGCNIEEARRAIKLVIDYLISSGKL